MSQSTKNSKPKSKKKMKVAAKAAVSTAPVAKSVTTCTPKAKIVQRSIGSMRVQHREFVDYMIPTQGALSAFSPKSYPLNPGQDETFSWLSNLALNWESYKFHKLAFHYVPRVPTSQAGSFLMAPDYDAADVAPLDEFTIMSYESAKESSVWAPLTINLDLKSLAGGRSRHFVRTGALAANLDIKTYDCGNLWVVFDANDSSSSGVAFGKLFVEYDVEFFTPQLPPTGDPLVGGATANSGAGTTQTLPLGTAPVNNVANNLGTFSYDGLTNIFTFAEDAKECILTSGLAGTGITAFTQPSLASKTGGFITPRRTPIINSAGTSGLATWTFNNCSRGDVISHLNANTATTISSSVVELMRTINGL